VALPWASMPGSSHWHVTTRSTWHSAGTGISRPLAAAAAGGGRPTLPMLTFATNLKAPLSVPGEAAVTAGARRAQIT
jgi:hypothetical protein